jgi:hypothetical protein
MPRRFRLTIDVPGHDPRNQWAWGFGLHGIVSPGVHPSFGSVYYLSIPEARTLAGHLLNAATRGEKLKKVRGLSGWVLTRGEKLETRKRKESAR